MSAKVILPSPDWREQGQFKRRKGVEAYLDDLALSQAEEVAQEGMEGWGDTPPSG